MTCCEEFSCKRLPQVRGVREVQSSPVRSEVKRTSQLPMA
jgi:hypothetical protein